MYAGTYKNNLPVIRQDIPDPYYGEPAKSNEYWTDQLLPYVMQNSKTIFAWTSPEDGVRYKKSVLWCPTWVAERTNLDPYKNLGTDRFRTGYSMNQWPSFQPNDPNPDALPPTSQSNWRGNGSNGRYWKKNEWTSPADRLLLADSNFWFIGFSPLKGAKTLPGQNFDINTWFTGSSTPGSMNIDRYRHGKYPGSDGTIYFTRGGLAHYNILYVDGHAVTSVDPIDAYRGIRMKFP